MNLEDYKSIIKPFLSEKRYYHSICVSQKAKAFAEKYGADVQKAETAGILHDIMKDLPPEQQLQKMKQYGIELSDVERSAQKLWHAMLGAAYIKNELHIDDPEILDAVRYHTTGRRNMSLLEKILFIADFVSDDRDYPGVEGLRRAAEVSLENAMIEGLAFTITDLAGQKKAIHPDTIEAYNQAALSYCQKNT